MRTSAVLPGTLVRRVQANPVGAFQVDGKEHFSMGHVSNTQYSSNCAQAIAAKYQYDKDAVVSSYWVTIIDSQTIYDDLVAEQKAREEAEAAKTRAAQEAAAKRSGPSL